MSETTPPPATKLRAPDAACNGGVVLGLARGVAVLSPRMPTTLALGSARRACARAARLGGTTRVDPWARGRPATVSTVGALRTNDDDDDALRVAPPRACCRRAPLGPGKTATLARRGPADTTGETLLELALLRVAARTTKRGVGTRSASRRDSEKLRTKKKSSWQRG